MKKFTAKLFASLLAATMAAGAMALPAAAAAEGSWKQDTNGWWYSYSTGSYAKNGWVKISDVWYYFAPNGYMKTGWVKDHDSWYYMTNSGAMKTGWLLDQGAWYFFTGNGVMKTGWIKSGNHWYYMDELGKMKTDSLLKLGEETYYLDENGIMFTGEMVYQGEKMTFDASGKLLKDSSVKIGPEGENTAETPKALEITFDIPDGWIMTSDVGMARLTREDTTTAYDFSNILILLNKLDAMSAEEKALLANPEAFVTDKDMLENARNSLLQYDSIKFKEVEVTGAVNKATSGKSAVTFTINVLVEQDSIEVPIKLSQTYILYDDAFVAVQLATEESLFATYEPDLNAILASIDVAFTSSLE